MTHPSALAADATMAEQFVYVTSVMILRWILSSVPISGQLDR